MPQASTLFSQTTKNPSGTDTGINDLLGALALLGSPPTGDATIAATTAGIWSPPPLPDNSGTTPSSGLGATGTSATGGSTGGPGYGADNLPVPPPLSGSTPNGAPFGGAGQGSTGQGTADTGNTGSGSAGQGSGQGTSGTDLPPGFNPGDPGDFGFHHHGHGGHIPSGSGTLTLGGTVTTVTTPITFGDGDYTLVDNEANAVITGGNGNISVTEIAAGATITLGNGNMTINDPGGSAVVTVGTGDMSIAIGGTGNTITTGPTNGGTADLTLIRVEGGSSTVTAGDGNVIVSAGGIDNTITVGTGNDIIQLGGCADPTQASITANTIYLGDGTNRVFLRGQSDVVHDGAGSDTIIADAASNETMIVNAAGGTIAVHGFTTTNGDVLDLSQILAGLPVAADLSNLGSYVTASSTTDSHNAAWTDTVLNITGTGGSATVTLINTGTLGLSDLIASHSITAT